MSRTSMAAAMSGVRPARLPRLTSAFALQRAAEMATNLVQRVSTVQAACRRCCRALESPGGGCPYEGGAPELRVSCVERGTLQQREVRGLDRVPVQRQYRVEEKALQAIRGQCRAW